MPTDAVEPELISSHKAGQRLMLIALLLIIPLIVLVYLYLQELDNKRQQLDNQLIGLDSIHRLYHLHDDFIDAQLPELRTYSGIKPHDHGNDLHHAGLPELQQAYHEFEQRIQQYRDNSATLSQAKRSQDFSGSIKQLEQLYYQSILNSGLLLLSSDDIHQKVNQLGNTLPKLHNALTDVLLNTLNLLSIKDVSLANDEIKKNISRINGHRALTAELKTTSNNVMLVSAANNTLDQAQKISEKIRRNIFFGLTEQDNTAEDLDTLYQLTTLSLDQLDYLARGISRGLARKIEFDQSALKRMQYIVLTLVSALIILSCLLFYYIASNIRQGQSVLTNQNRLLEEGIKERTRELFEEKKVINQLNEELVRQSQKASAMAQVANSANQAKSLFLASMSHEIRTPMNAVLGGANQLVKTDLSEKQKESLLLIQRSGETLMDIINDILDFSKIETGEMKLENIEFDLEKIAIDLMTMFSGRAQEKSINLNYRFDASCEGLWKGDPTRIKQIIMNLLSNAIKFTQSGCVTLSIERSPNNHLHCAITDTGIGIKKDAIPHLFESFTQAESNITRRFGGSGLGLSICKKLIQLMGSDISVKSQYGEGSSFSFDLNIPQISDVHSNDDQTPLLLIDPESSYPQEPLWGFSKIEVRHSSTEKSDKSFQAVLTTAPDIADHISTSYPLSPTLLLDPQCAKASLISSNAQALVIKVPKYGFNKDLRQIIHLAGDTHALLQHLHADMDDLPHTQELQLQGKVLLVEDVEFNQIIAMDLLEDLGLEVSCANNGEEAVEKSEAESFDLILMDIHMPVMDGIQATVAIREREKKLEQSSIPIIALTADVIKETGDQIHQSGMYGYLSKPIDEQVLEETLAKYLPKAG